MTVTPIDRRKASAWLGVDWSEHRRWVRVQGRWANVVDVGSGPAILFIHGLGGNWQSWLENLPAFMDGHRVVAMDLPGFGHSEMPRERITIDGYASWLAALMDELGIDRATLVGNSMGGFIGADAAVNQPDRIDKLVLVSAAALWNERRRARPLVTLSKLTKAYSTKLAAQWELAHRHPNLRGPILFQTGIRHPRRLAPELAWEIMSGAGSPGFADALEALYRHRIRDDLERISCPTLIVWGTHDQLVPLKHAFEYEAMIEDARVVVYHDTGHLPMLERPAEFNAELAQFLASDLAARKQPATSPAQAR